MACGCPFAGAKMESCKQARVKREVLTIDLNLNDDSKLPSQAICGRRFPKTKSTVAEIYTIGTFRSDVQQLSSFKSILKTCLLS